MSDEAERKRASEYTLRLAAELRAQREEHEAEIGWPPRLPAKIETRDMLRYLAMNKLDPDCGIPAAIIDAIALRIAPKQVWAKQQAAARKLDAVRNMRVIQAEADKVRAEFPNYQDNDSWVARKIIQRVDGKLTRGGKDGARKPVKLNLGTVRQQISRK
jgi:hypothetical protein